MGVELSQYYRYKENGTIYLVYRAMPCGELRDKLVSSGHPVCCYYKVAHPQQPNGAYYCESPDLSRPFAREEWEFDIKFKRLTQEEARHIGLPYCQSPVRSITTDKPLPLEGSP